MKRSVSIILRYFLGIAFTICNAQPSSSNPRNTWHWFSKSPEADTMCVEVYLQNKMIYHAESPISARDYKDDSQQDKKILEFFFEANCNIFVTGEDKSEDSLDPLFESFGRQRIEGNVWQAGKDTDAIWFGISFVAKNQILLNSLHIAKHDYICRTGLAKDLFVKTFLLNKNQMEWSYKKRK